LVETLFCIKLFYCSVVGGPGHVVHVDESVVTKRKYHRGRAIPQVWALGIYDSTLRVGYVAIVRNRRAATIMEHIERVVRPGTEIWTDQFASYQGLGNVGGVAPYVHRTVNHSKNFVDPVTGVCTNAVETFWSRLKGFMRRLGVMSSPFMDEYLDQFMWAQHFGDTPQETYSNLLEQIKERYPV